MDYASKTFIDHISSQLKLDIFDSIVVSISACHLRTARRRPGFDSPSERYDSFVFAESAGVGVGCGCGCEGVLLGGHSQYTK